MFIENNEIIIKRMFLYILSKTMFIMGFWCAVIGAASALDNHLTHTGFYLKIIEFIKLIIGWPWF